MADPAMAAGNYGDYSLLPIDHDPFGDVGASMARHLTGNPAAGPGPNLAQAFLDWRNSGQSWADQYHDYAQRAVQGPQAALDAAGNPMDLFGGFVGSTTPEGGGLKGITAYHGSPYDFSKFDISKIGTGEGAQAYGHGLYFAENEGTAKAYRDQLAGQPTISGENIWDQLPWMQRTERQHATRALMDAINSGKTGDDAVHAAMGQLTQEGNLASASHVRQPLYTASNNLAPLLGKDWQSAPGKMYQVSIAADPEHFLDWDKPLSEQHPAIKDMVLKSLGAETPTLVGQGPNGRWLTMDEKGNVIGRSDGWPDQGTAQDAARVLSQDAQRMLSKTPGDLLKTPSQSINMDRTDKLRQAGIPGIKYLDQGSRFQPQQLQTEIANAQQDLAQARQSGQSPDVIKIHEDALAALQKRAAEVQTHNYVVFDDKLIDIIKKYGIAGLIAGGAAHFSTQPVDHNPYAQ